MSSSLTNRDDIIANSFSIIAANGSVVDVLDAVQGSIVGLPPSGLNTIEKLSADIPNDPNYFQQSKHLLPLRPRHQQLLLKQRSALLFR